MLTSEQFLHPGMLQDKQVLFPVSENPVAHVTQTLACWHNWQLVTPHWTQVFGALRVKPGAQVRHVVGFEQNWQLAEQFVFVWHCPVDEIPHGAKQKLHVVLLIPQYRQL